MSAKSGSSLVASPHGLLSWRPCTGHLWMTLSCAPKRGDVAKQLLTTYPEQFLPWCSRNSCLGSRDSAEFDQHWSVLPKALTMLATIGQDLANIGQVRRICPILGRCKPKRIRPWPAPSNLRRASPHFRQIRPTSGQHRPALVELGRISAPTAIVRQLFGHSWSTSDSRPGRDRPGATFRDARRAFFR